MKTRLGFVSNSSSSSFVLIVPKDMEPTTENFYKELFGGIEKFEEVYREYPIITTSGLSENIAEQIKSETKEDDGSTIWKEKK